ncbi:hypothetical protein RHGRI_036138 [Rhododendron griersonianum]|uniref:Uncharacterized protein n=1 Tax=Rhododendron griersonianum TaxID=479676 RepID=A0AAV6HLW8_9ERIC|nr:hypothetical protein RHGRI_036138 [Rhododendron griersonianum]
MFVDNNLSFVLSVVIDFWLYRLISVFVAQTFKRRNGGLATSMAAAMSTPSAALTAANAAPRLGLKWKTD